MIIAAVGGDRSPKKRIGMAAIASLVCILCAACNTGSDVTNLGNGPEDKDIPYRTVNVLGDHPLPPTNSDMVGLVLALQEGRMSRSWVHIMVSNCYGPEVRDGVPSVMCDEAGRGDVYIAGQQNIREILLGLRQDSKRAALKGRVVGLHADRPVIWVDAPLAQRGGGESADGILDNYIRRVKNALSGV